MNSKTASSHFTFSIHFHRLLLTVSGQTPPPAVHVCEPPDGGAEPLLLFKPMENMTPLHRIATALNIFIPRDEAAHVCDYGRCSYNVGLNSVFIFGGC